MDGKIFGRLRNLKAAFPDSTSNPNLVKKTKKKRLLLLQPLYKFEKSAYTV